MEYTVYLSLYGKKMKVEIEAPNPDAARKQVRDDVKFHKIVEVEQELEFLKNIFGMK